MKITYVLDRPELCGGVKVVLQHASLLCALGHDVTVLGCGPRPAWVPFGGSYVDYSDTGPVLEAQDLVVATFWTTVARAVDLDRGPVAHFCQGYEGDLAHLAAQRPEIEAAYKRALPAFVVAPHLAELLRVQFGKASRLVPPPLDPRFRPAWRVRPRRQPWIMIPGIFEADVKGVATALRAVALLRRDGWPCRVARTSGLPLSGAERSILKPDRYLCLVDPDVVARTLRHCDLLLFPSLEMEGFGLPLLEAMTSKVPVVASRIPATEFIGSGHLTLVTPRDPAALAAAAKAILGDSRGWRRARRAGYAAAQRFHPREVASQLTAAIEWAASGGRRT